MMEELSKIKAVLEEHLSAINETTNEIQALFDYLQEIELKVEKLSQRLDTFQLSSLQQQAPKPASLASLEKKVFLVFYTEELPLTFSEIAVKSGLPLSLIPDCISSLISKNVPLLRSMVNNQMFFRLSPSFKEQQAKENIINLSLECFIE